MPDSISYMVVYLCLKYDIEKKKTHHSVNAEVFLFDTAIFSIKDEK